MTILLSLSILNGTSSEEVTLGVFFFLYPIALRMAKTP